MNRSTLITKPFFVFALFALGFTHIATAGSLYYTRHQYDLGQWHDGRLGDLARRPLHVALARRVRRPLPGHCGQRDRLREASPR